MREGREAWRPRTLSCAAARPSTANAGPRRHARFVEADSNTPLDPLLFPASPRDWLPEGHLACFIADTVAALDLAPFHHRLVVFASAAFNLRRLSPLTAAPA